METSLPFFARCLKYYNYQEVWVFLNQPKKNIIICLKNTVRVRPRLTGTVRTVAVASPSGGASRATASGTVVATTSNRGPALVTSRRSSAPTWRRSSVVPHNWRRATHRRTCFLHQNCAGRYFLAIDLPSVHVFDGIFSPVWIDEIYIAKTSGERLEPVHRKVHGTNFTVGSKDLHDVVLDDISREPSDVYSGGSWCHGTFLPATFRSGPRSTTADIFAGSFRRRSRRATRLGLFVFLVIVPLDAATTFLAFF